MVHPQPGADRSCPDVSVTSPVPLCQHRDPNKGAEGRIPGICFSLGRAPPGLQSPRSLAPAAAPAAPARLALDSRHLGEEGEGSAPAAQREAVSAAPLLFPGSRNRLYTLRIIMKIVTNYSEKRGCEPRWIWGRFSSWPFRNTQGDRRPARAGGALADCAGRGSQV